MSCHNSMALQSRVVQQNATARTKGQSEYAQLVLKTSLWSVHLYTPATCVLVLVTRQALLSCVHWQALECPPGRQINAIGFASYGNPRGDCSEGLQLEPEQPFRCAGANTVELVSAACVGMTNCSLQASDEMFSSEQLQAGSPCTLPDLRLAVSVRCSAVGYLETLWPVLDPAPGAAAAADIARAYEKSNETGAAAAEAARVAEVNKQALDSAQTGSDGAATQQKQADEAADNAAKQSADKTQQLNAAKHQRDSAIHNETLTGELKIHLAEQHGKARVQLEQARGVLESLQQELASIKLQITQATSMMNAAQPNSAQHAEAEESITSLDIS